STARRISKSASPLWLPASNQRHPPLTVDNARSDKRGGSRMIVAVFRSRLNPGAQDEYGPMARRMSELVGDIPGYISHKAFVADDGERVTIVKFETKEAPREWRIHPQHGTAKRHAIESLFAQYKFQIRSVIRDRSWAGRTRETDGHAQRSRGRINALLNR